MKKAFLLVAVALGFAVWSGTAMAQQVQGNLTVQLEIVDGCTVGSGTGGGTDWGSIDFGSHSEIISANIDADSTGTSTADIEVICTNGLAYEIGLNNGQNAVSGQRYVLDSVSSDTVPYDLYQDTGRTTAWGDIGSGNELSASGNGAVQTVVVYGRVPAQATTPSSGTYTDTVQVTVAW